MLARNFFEPRLQSCIVSRSFRPITAYLQPAGVCWPHEVSTHRLRWGSNCPGNGSG